MAPPAPSRLYLEDFSVGQVFTHPRHATMELGRIQEFAAEFDPQPFHLDEAAAAAHPIFAGLAASGWHTASVTARLLIESIPFADGLVGLNVEVSWPRPTRPGDQLSIHTTVAAIKPSRSKPDRGVITLCTETYNQHQEVVQLLAVKVLVRRRPPPTKAAQ